MIRAGTTAIDGLEPFHTSGTVVAHPFQQPFHGKICVERWNDFCLSTFSSRDFSTTACGTINPSRGGFSPSLRAFRSTPFPMGERRNGFSLPPASVCFPTA